MQTLRMRLRRSPEELRERETKARARQSDKANRGNNQKNDACHQDPANEMERLQPGIDGVPENHDVLQSLAEYKNWRENEKNFAEANNSREKI